MWHCSTIRKFAGSVPDDNPSDRREDSASNSNEYQKHFLGGKGDRWVGLTTLPPSCFVCLEIWEPQPLENLRACPGLYKHCVTIFICFLNILLDVLNITKFAGNICLKYTVLHIHLYSFVKKITKHSVFSSQHSNHIFITWLAAAAVLMCAFPGTCQI